MSIVPKSVRDAAEAGGFTPNPARRGPVLLDRYFRELSVMHVALPQLTPGSAARYLLQFLHAETPDEVDGLWDCGDKLAGLIFQKRFGVVALVNADDSLPRRRFTAAHELGHAVLHREVMGSVLQDADVDDADGKAAGMESEANRFAAELLMPEVVLRARADELRAAHGCCPRVVLGYRLASELLVSREAIGYRLKNLGVGDGE